MAVLEDEETEIYFSTVSAWEIVIKYSLWKQAAKEGMPLMTADPMVRQYPGISLFWAA